MRWSDRLHGGPPLLNADVAEVEPDLTGWGSNHPIFEAAIVHYRPSLVIEVGTWKGGSAIHMAKRMKAHLIEGEIVCVDTWLGAPIAWTSEPELQASLRLKAGYPDLYRTFARNVVDAGVVDIITPLPASSDGAHTVLSHYGAEADVIYIDGDHDYEPVKRDLANYFEFLTPDGILICDDYGCWPGVTRAATEFREEHNLYAVKQKEKLGLSRVDIAQRLGLVCEVGFERRPAAA